MLHLSPCSYRGNTWNLNHTEMSLWHPQPYFTEAACQDLQICTLWPIMVTWWAGISLSRLNWKGLQIYEKHQAQEGNENGAAEEIQDHLFSSNQEIVTDVKLSSIILGEKLAFKISVSLRGLSEVVAAKQLWGVSEDHKLFLGEAPPFCSWCHSVRSNVLAYGCQSLPPGWTNEFPQSCPLFSSQVWRTALNPFYERSPGKKKGMDFISGGDSLGCQWVVRRQSSF